MQCVDEILYLYFTALERTTMLLIMDLAKLPLHFCLCTIFIRQMELGIFGLALAMNTTYFLKLVLTFFIVGFQRKREQVLRDSLFISCGADTLNGFKAFLKLASAGFILSCIEWWVSEGLTVMAGYLGVATLAASVVVNALAMLMSHLTMGFSFTISAMVGSALGAGKVEKAKRIAFQAFVACYSYVIVCVVGCVAYRFKIAAFFSSDPEVIALTSLSLEAYSFVYLFDSVQQILQGMIKGLGI